ncbi:DUF6313 family protein [Streptosporangium roseum]|uniref:DUF6313 family protein n=1 Tax=Streptosporangium roseum TaxID=2001 RepID=UPI0033249F5F
MTKPSGERHGDVDLPPPPREPVRHGIRRWWRSLERHHGLRYWLPTRGAPILAVFGLLFAVNGLTIGWRRAYDVTIGITSPADTSIPVLAWFLSVAGWLLAPGIAGAVAGYVVSDAIGARRTRPLDDFFPEAGDE